MSNKVLGKQTTITRNDLYNNSHIHEFSMVYGLTGGLRVSYKTKQLDRILEQKQAFIDAYCSDMTTEAKDYIICMMSDPVLFNLIAGTMQNLKKFSICKGKTTKTYFQSSSGKWFVKVQRGINSRIFFAFNKRRELWDYISKLKGWEVSKIYRTCWTSYQYLAA